MAKEMYIEGSHVAPVVKALSSDVRLKILSLLSSEDLNVQTLAQRLGLSKTATLMHINVLEQAGFLKSEYRSGSAGGQRFCHKTYDRLIFDFDPSQNATDDTAYYQTEVPVGNYFGFDAWPPCGLATHSQIIQKWDDPSTFCHPDRVQASLVWTAFGYVEYLVPMDPLFMNKRITKVRAKIEISTHHMVKNHKALLLPEGIGKERITEDITDVTVWLNGVEAGCGTIGLGANREAAIYTPSWWRTTPYCGEILRASVDETGCYINGVKTSQLTSRDILKDTDRFFSLRFGIKPTAEHMNGIMLFGRDFGQYNHGLLVSFYIAD